MPNVFHIMQFRWYEPILYYNPDAVYLETKEEPRYFVGFGETLEALLLLKVWQSENGPKSYTAVTVTLSSTEADYIAMVECAQDLVFTRTLVAELKGEKKKAIKYGKNTGLLFLADNKQVSQCTKHINVQHHYLQGLAKQKEVATKFQRSEHNCADVMTKNVSV